MLEFLPKRLYGALRNINLNLLYEMRVRAGKPLVVNVGGTFCFLGERGPCEVKEAILPSQREVEDTLLAACNYSLYSVENQLRQGFLTASDGERIGLAGTVVYENGTVHAIRDITSLCIRIPHEILGCAEEIYRVCFVEHLCSVLILAPPGEGKTTILRDLSRLVSMRTGHNILVCDERGELGAGDVGVTSDVVRFSEKETAFTAAIRAMRPEVIVTDELLPKDYMAVRRAIESGIVVFASAHLMRYEDVPEKIFDYYVALNGLGKIGCVWGREGKLCG